MVSLSTVKKARERNYYYAQYRLLLDEPSYCSAEPHTHVIAAADTHRYHCSSRWQALHARNHRNENTAPCTPPREPTVHVFSLWFVALGCRVVSDSGPPQRWVHRRFARRRNSATHGKGMSEAIVPHRGSTGAAFPFQQLFSPWLS